MWKKLRSGPWSRRRRAATRMPPRSSSTSTTPASTSTRRHAWDPDLPQRTLHPRRFAKVVRELGRFKWRGAGFEGWLFRIARNVIVDMLRRGGKEALTGEAIEPVETSREGLPETTMVNLESATELRALLDRLPPEQREVLLLRFGAGLDTNETGRAMDKNANAVRQLQLRALRNVRAMIPEKVTDP